MMTIVGCKVAESQRHAIIIIIIITIIFISLCHSRCLIPVLSLL